MSNERVNYHHLFYFWAVAKDGNLTRTAKRLRVAQSALSSQVRQLEDSLGQPLFERQGRGLVLTEPGRIALGYAESIFAAGAELVSTLRQGRSREQVLRVGAVSTLSRNFQDSFLRPLLGQPAVRLRVRAGNLEGLLAELSSHALDVVLSNRAPQRTADHAWRARRIARQEVAIVGRGKRRRFRFPDDLREAPMIVPGVESDVRTEFDALCEQLGVRVTIVAEVDDMATMRLLARHGDAIALVPSVVVREELRSGLLHAYGVVPGLYESFYAITVDRQYQHPMLRGLLTRSEAEILAVPEHIPAGPPAPTNGTVRGRKK